MVEDDITDEVVLNPTSFSLFYKKKINVVIGNYNLC